ncbi:tissue inhibitor of metalloproteinase isoform X2 [Plodia interpunctella]|uniref:tissue inhibitor of metalloproteinase isoform X2 n=1 Tax=Plodia interpunctella TaxID=58824 RepID=UPI002368923A|nr:tissue inhibitor of metalloproteinase isoform X2 [Plodia interpunctella]
MKLCKQINYMMVDSMVTRWLALALLASSWRLAAACTCQPDHPQTHFCTSDFVIVGRVQKTFRGGYEFFDAYKVKIRNFFKATPKARLALRSGRLLTASQESMCGLELQPRETYLITGNIRQLQAHVDLCGYTRRWRDVTPRQRKGFRMLYKNGCACKVHMNRRRTKSPNTCVANYNDCYERHGICLHDRARRCRWTRTPALTRCMQAHYHNSTMRPV